MNNEKYLSRIVPVLREKGLGISMESIADSIGVTKKTLYNRFSTKDELIDVCVESLQKEFRTRVGCLTDMELPVEVAFRKGIEELRFFFRDCSHSFITDLSRYYPGMASASHLGGTEFFESRLRSNIERGKAEGVYRAEIDSALFSRYIAVSIFGFFQREVMRSAAFSADHYFNQVIDYNINALTAHKK